VRCAKSQIWKIFAECSDSTNGHATATDGRQSSQEWEAATRPLFIDHGYCFNAGEWSFPDSPLRGVYANPSVYEDVAGWECFEPILSRAEQIDSADLWTLTEGMPEEWWSRHDSGDLSRLIENLCQRRSCIRDLITAFRNSTRNPFPNWTGN